MLRGNYVKPFIGQQLQQHSFLIHIAWERRRFMFSLISLHGCCFYTWEGCQRGLPASFEKIVVRTYKKWW